MCASTIELPAAANTAPSPPSASAATTAEAPAALMPSGLPAPDVSIDWSDVHIEARLLDARVDEDRRPFKPLFPVLDDGLISAKAQTKLLKASRTSVPERHSFTLTSALNGGGDLYRKAAETASRARARMCSGGSDASQPMQVAAGQQLQRKLVQQGGGGIIRSALSVAGSSGSNHCHICGRLFEKQTHLKRHVLTHSSTKPFKCTICGWGFFQQSNLKRHMLTHSNSAEGSGFKCAHCKAVFTTKSVLSVHMRDAHADKKISPMMQSGHSPHTSVGSATPSPVARAAADLKLPNNHDTPSPIGSISEEVRNKPLACHLCGKQFSKNTNLKQHLMLHVGEKPYKCSVCGWRFTQSCNLKKHMKTHTQDLRKTATRAGENPATRKTAKTKLPQASSAAREDEPRNDPDCASQDNNGRKNLAVRQRRKLKRKRDKRDKKMKGRTPTCEECGSEFGQLWYLKKHILAVHRGLKEYQCEDCGKEYRWKHSLDAHFMECHLNIKREDLQCTYCDKTFNERNGLKRHTELIHEKRKDWKCLHCGKMFGLKTYLEKHVRGVHGGGIKDFKCPECGSEFALRDGLRVHIKRVHGNARNFLCNQCPKKFQAKHHLLRHMKLVHKSKIIPRLILTKIEPTLAATKYATASR